MLYRHFVDRADLQRAVGQEAAALLMARMAPALSTNGEPREVVRAIVDAFLAGIEDEPELWRFVVHHPVERAPGAEIVDDARAEIAAMLAARARRPAALARAATPTGPSRVGARARRDGAERGRLVAGAAADEPRRTHRPPDGDHLGRAVRACWSEEHVLDGYSGPATLTVDGRRVPVHAVLDARHEPQDGRLHWFGRLRPRPTRRDGQ